MNYLIKSTALALLFVFLADCGGPPAVTSNDGDRLLRDDEDYDRRKREDENRGNILDRSRTRYTGRTCEDEDDNRHDCVEQCRDIYSRRSDREDCEELPIKQIEILEDLHELLEDP